jgi:hypothetical protein
MRFIPAIDLSRGRGSHTRAMNLIGNVSSNGAIEIPVILLLSVGLIAFGAWRRHPGWWLMTGGIAILLLGYIAQTLIFQTAAGSTAAGIAIFLIRLREWGILIFALGFATIGAVVVRLHRRNLELEPDSSAGKNRRPGKGGRGS